MPRLSSHARGSCVLKVGVGALLLTLADGFMTAVSGQGSSGHVQWTFPSGAGSSGSCNIDNAGPVVLGGIVYFTSASDWKLHALVAKSGAERWNFSLEQYATAPAAADGLVYVASWVGDQLMLYALDAHNGTITWSTKLEGDSPCGPPVVGDGMVYLLSSMLHALDAKSGSLRWTVKNPHWWRIANSPAVSDGTVFVAADMLYAFNGLSGKQLWTMIQGSQWSSPVVAGGLVYISWGGRGSSQVQAIDTSDGKMRWEQSIPDNYAPLTAAFADGRLFFSGASSTLTALDSTTGEQLWSRSNLCESHLWSVPTVSNGRVYVGSDTDGILHVLDAATGASLWSFTANGAVRSPAVVDGIVYFGANDMLWAVAAPDAHGTTASSLLV